MTRSEAQAAGLKHYDTCKPCSYGHVPTTRRVGDGACLECERVNNRISYATNREMHLNSSRRWKENNRERLKAYAEATKERKAETQATYRRANAPELRAKKYEWRRANPDKQHAEYARRYALHKEEMKAKNAAWFKAHPLEARIRVHARRVKMEAAGTHTKQDILALLSLQRGRCAYCRKDIRRSYTIDHIIPLFLGGSNNRDNLQLVCKPCNSRKGKKHPVDFAQGLGLLV